MKALPIVIMSMYLNVSYAQKTDTTKTFVQGKELDEVVVKTSYLTRKDDHILAIPTKEQRKHAVTGYDMLSNLMVPGVSVDRLKGSVTTPNGAATLYIVIETVIIVSRIISIKNIIQRFCVRKCVQSVKIDTWTIRFVSSVNVQNATVLDCCISFPILRHSIIDIIS
jgi:hypothetical protein